MPVDVFILIHIFVINLPFFFKEDLTVVVGNSR